jgi:phosphomannomutase
LAYGYEEALGYCVDPKTVNDKDGISAAILIAEMAGDLKERGLTIEGYLEQVYKNFGYHLTDQISIRVSDTNKSELLLKKILDNPPKVLLNFDLESIENINAQKELSTPGVRLKYSGGIRVIIRPSGTEAKLKCYIEVIGDSKLDLEKLMSQVKQVLIKVLS